MSFAADLTRIAASTQIRKSTAPGRRWTDPPIIVAARNRQYNHDRDDPHHKDSGFRPKTKGRNYLIKAMPSREIQKSPRKQISKGPYDEG
jgi:hypothetical protein